MGPSTIPQDIIDQRGRVVPSIIPQNFIDQDGTGTIYNDPGIMDW